ncbi:MAG TPA: glycosyltransferase family 1 protein [Candidatus Atribacteria bacterium]|nr:glycosyltransferase family 1 protein [Candidatus Atribacteria bacterium]
MRIAIDLITITGKNAGLQSYAKQLVEGIAKVDKKNEYILLINSRAKKLFTINQPNFKNIFIHTPKRFIGIWEQIYFPFIQFLKEVDLLHSPVSAVPIVAPCKTVLTIHDLTFKIYPKTMQWWDRFYWNFFITQGVKRVERIITDSISTKKDLIKYYNIQKNKVSVIPLCCSSQYYMSSNEFFLNEIKQKYNINKPYILFVGTLEPRKNISILLKAFNIAKQKGKLKHSLVIVGRKGWLFDDIFQIVKNLRMENDVIFTGFVPDEDLPSLYHGSDLFVYPSIYEGFGLPPLEAMACGTPVIASNSSSLPEVVGDAGILIDPKDVNAFASVIVRVLNKEELKIEFAKKGKLWAQRFTTEKMAYQTIKVYKKIIEAG